MTTRDYTPVADAVRAALPEQADLEHRMRVVVDALWEAFSARGYSWCGFYTAVQGATEMTLGPRRDKPACSPIGLHGVCGLGFRTGAAVIVGDVRTLGEGYVACDPRDMSEVVVPVLGDDGSVMGVIDVDSFDFHAFDDSDVLGLVEVLETAGIPTPGEGLSIVHR